MRTTLDRMIGVGVGLLLLGISPVAWIVAGGRQLDADVWLSAAWVGMAGVAVLTLAVVGAVGSVILEQAGSCRQRRGR